jgi:acetyltransferase-like isoleucine patch superfamily enzyme
MLYRRYLKNPRVFLSDRKNKVSLSRSCSAVKAVFEGKNKVYHYASVNQSIIHRGSYVGPWSRLNRCLIGRYCSIGPDVHIISGRHPISERPSSHPCFFSTKMQAGFTYVEEDSFEELVFIDKNRGLVVEIGSDVWIGSRASIMAGVRIGHGAIIAAGSLLTKDAEPYGIYVGSPAKLVRYRFEEETRHYLLKLKWWDRSEEWIMQNLNFFLSFERPAL